MCGVRRGPAASTASSIAATTAGPTCSGRSPRACDRAVSRPASKASVARATRARRSSWGNRGVGRSHQSPSWVGRRRSGRRLLFSLPELSPCVRRRHRLPFASRLQAWPPRVPQVLTVRCGVLQHEQLLPPRRPSESSPLASASSPSDVTSGSLSPSAAPPDPLSLPRLLLPRPSALPPRSAPLPPPPPSVPAWPSASPSLAPSPPRWLSSSRFSGLLLPHRSSPPSHPSAPSSPASSSPPSAVPPSGPCPSQSSSAPLSSSVWLSLCRSPPFSLPSSSDSTSLSPG